MGLLVSAGLIAYFIRALDWSAVGEELLRTNYLIVLPLTPVVLAPMLVRAWRWRYFLPQGNEVGLRALFDSLMIGALATFLLPLRAGEFVRPFVLSLKHPVPFSAGLVSVVIERFFDLAAVLATFGLLVLLLPDMRPEVYHGAQALAAVAGAILAVIGLGAFQPGLVQTLSRWCARPLPAYLRRWIEHFTEQFLAGTKVLRRPANLIMALILTAAVWLGNYLVYYSYLYLVNVEPTLLLGVTVTVLLALVVSAPSMPGFIGVYQLGCVWAFELLGQRPEVGLAYALVTHLFQYVVLGFYGGYVMLRDGMRFSDLTAARGPARQTVE
jgi:glycosyltransferase 2 family protein